MIEECFLLPLVSERPHVRLDPGAPMSSSPAPPGASGAHGVQIRRPGLVRDRGGPVRRRSARWPMRAAGLPICVPTTSSADRPHRGRRRSTGRHYREPAALAVVDRCVDPDPTPIRGCSHSMRCAGQLTPGAGECSARQASCRIGSFAGITAPPLGCTKASRRRWRSTASLQRELRPGVTATWCSSVRWPGPT